MDFKRLTSCIFFFSSLIFAQEAAWSSCFLDASDYIFFSSSSSSSSSQLGILILSLQHCFLPRVMKGVDFFFFPASSGDVIAGLGIFTVFLHAAVPGVENHSSGWGKRGGKARNSFECKEKPCDVT